MSLKEKTLHGLSWSFLDNLANQGIKFITGIVLARILSPREFGLIGMITVFIAITQSFIDSGFSQALIRKQNCSQADYSTVFFFNLIVSVFFYLVLFLGSGWISLFFQEPQLQQLLQVLAICLIINALTIIQYTRLVKEINFKLQTRISIIASFTSGAIGIIAALKGMGAMSLVLKTVSEYLLRSFFLWLWNNWRPSWSFDFKSFKEMYGFGSRLMVSGIIDTLYKNMYNIIIGKYFTASDLGYYTRADQFQMLPSQNLTSVIQNVSYPILSSIQDDKEKLKLAAQKLIKSIMLISFVVMMGMSGLSKQMVLTLIGPKWLPSVPYLQLLCFIGMLYPWHAINLNILNVMGRSDLFLRLEIIKKSLIVPAVFIGIKFGIEAMIISVLIVNFFGLYLNSFWTGKFINYPLTEQIKDVFPSFLLGIATGGLLYALNYLNIQSPLILLLIQLTAGATFSLGIAEILKLKDYYYIRETIREKLSKK